MGPDRFGAFCRDLWTAEGIDISGVAGDQAALIGVYFIEPAGEGPDFLPNYRKGSAASRMTSATVPGDLIRRSGFLITSAISQAISASACDAVYHAIAVAREAGRKVAYDTNLCLNLWSLAYTWAIIHDTTRPAHQSFFLCAYCLQNGLWGPLSINRSIVRVPMARRGGTTRKCRRKPGTI